MTDPDAIPTWDDTRPMTRPARPLALSAAPVAAGPSGNGPAPVSIPVTISP